MKFISAVTECIGRFNDRIRCAFFLSWLSLFVACALLSRGMLEPALWLVLPAVFFGFRSEEKKINDELERMKPGDGF